MFKDLQQGRPCPVSLHAEHSPASQAVGYSPSPGFDVHRGRSGPSDPNRGIVLPSSRTPWSCSGSSDISKKIEKHQAKNSMNNSPTSSISMGITVGFIWLPLSSGHRRELLSIPSLPRTEGEGLAQPSFREIRHVRIRAGVPGRAIWGATWCIMVPHLRYAKVAGQLILKYREIPGLDFSLKENKLRAVRGPTVQQFDGAKVAACHHCQQITYS